MIWNELDMVKRKKHEFYEELPDSADDNEIERLSKEFFKGIRQITRLPKKVSPPDRGVES